MRRASRRIDARLDVAHARGGVDQLLVERAPVFAERVDLALELGLVFGRLPLFGADGVELLVVLFEGFGIGLRGAAARPAASVAAGAPGAGAAGALARRSLRERGPVAPSGSARAKAEPSTRRGSVRRDRRRIMLSNGRRQPQERKTKQSRCDRNRTLAGCDPSQMSETRLRTIKGAVRRR